MSMLGIQKALIVDADGDIVHQVVRILKRCGATDISHTIKLRSAGIRISAGEVFDVIVVDIQADEIGSSSVGAILGGDSYQGISNIPILFIAQVNCRKDVQTLQDIGCYHFVMKPLNDNILEQKIKELALKKYDPARELELANEIEGAIKLNNYVGAEKLIKPALRRFPASIKFQILLAELFLVKGDLRSSQSIVSKVLQIDSKFEPAIILLNRLQGKADEIDAASQRASEEVERQQRFKEAIALNTKALNLVKENLFDEAIKIYQKAISQSDGMPTRHIILYNAAFANFKSGNNEQAELLCKQSVEISPIDYDSPKTLIAKIAEAVAKVEADNEAKKQSSTNTLEAFLSSSASGQAGNNSLGKSGNADILLDPDEELRILKFVMFEGKY